MDAARTLQLTPFGTRVADTGRIVGPKVAAAPQDTVQISNAAPATPAAAPANQKKWTFLFYIDGNTDAMHKMAPSMIRQLEFAGSDKNINVVAQVGRKGKWYDLVTRDWSGVRRYEVPELDKELDQGAAITELFRTLLPPYTRGIESTLKQELGKADMADPNTLADFLKWGIANYPAEHYAVVFVGPNGGITGMMTDETSKNRLELPELKQALAEAHAVTGRKLDLVAIDGSNGTTAEMAYQIKDHVKYLVGSEGLVAGNGMAIPSMMFEVKKSNQDKSRDGKTVAQTMTMVGSMAAASGAFAPTISALDLDKMDGVKNSLDTLGNALMAANVDKKLLRDIIEETQEVAMPGVTRAYEGMKDAYHFAQLIDKNPAITDGNVKAAAQAVMAAVDDAVVGEAHASGFYWNAHGISVFLPKDYGFIRPDSIPVRDWDRKFGYENLDFAKQSNWTRFLTQVSEEGPFQSVVSKVIGEGGLDHAYAFKRAMDPTISYWSGWASTVGWWESWNMLGSTRPSKFLLIPAKPAAVIGAWGGLWDTYNSLKSAYYSATELKNTDAVIYNLSGAVGGLAKTVACAGLLRPELAPIAVPAAWVGFLRPWIMDAYGLYVDYKNTRDSIALSNASTTERLSHAIQVHYQKDRIWTDQ